jgi:hypothetical protein
MIEAVGGSLTTITDTQPSLQYGRVPVGRRTRGRVEHFVKREIIAEVPEYMVAPEYHRKAIGRFDVPTGHNLPAGQSGKVTFLVMPTGEFQSVKVTRECDVYSPWAVRPVDDPEADPMLYFWAVFDDERDPEGQYNAARLVRVIVPKGGWLG